MFVLDKFEQRADMIKAKLYSIKCFKLGFFSIFLKDYYADERTLTLLSYKILAYVSISDINFEDCVVFIVL